MTTFLELLRLRQSGLGCSGTSPVGSETVGTGGPGTVAAGRIEVPFGIVDGTSRSTAFAEKWEKVEVRKLFRATVLRKRRFGDGRRRVVEFVVVVCVHP